MPIKGLKDNARRTSVSQLNARLADLLALKLALKQAHWTVKGPGFMAIHVLLDEVAARVEEQTDTIAERVQALGGTALGTAEVVATASTMAVYPTDMVAETDHLMALCARIADLGEKARAAIAEVGEAGDEGTVDVFVGLSRQLDKDLWFLESHLGA